MGVPPPISMVATEESLGERNEMGSTDLAAWADSPRKHIGVNERHSHLPVQSEYGASFAVSSGQADSGVSRGSGGVLHKSSPSRYAETGHIVPSSTRQRDYMASVSATNENFQRTQSIYDSYHFDSLGLLDGEEDELYGMPSSHRGSDHTQTQEQASRSPSSGREFPLPIRQPLGSLDVTLDRDFEALPTETDLRISGFPGSSPWPDPRILSSSCEPSEKAISKPSQQRRRIEESNSPADNHPAKLGLPNNMNSPENLATSQEEGMEIKYQPRPGRGHGTAARSENSGRQLPHADVIFGSQARSGTPRTLSTMLANCITRESTTKAIEPKPNSSYTDTQSLSCTSGITVELDGDPSISRCQSPWLDRWFEEGPTSGFREFGSRIASSGTCTGSAGAPLDGHLTVQDQRIDAVDKHSGEPVQAKSSGADPRISGNSSSSPSSLGKRSNEVTRNTGRGDGGCSDGNFDDGDNNDGPSHPQRRRITGRTVAESTSEKYACPYQKRYPSQNHLCGLPHGKRTYYGWDTVSRVKQHLLRSHGKSYHCSHCWKAFSAKPDDGRCNGGKCPSRPQPDKHWLTDEQVPQLETEKIPNSVIGWYRLVAILFPDLPEEGEGGYRSSYTPYYCMWTEPTTKLAATVSQNTEMDLFASFDFVADAVPEFPLEGANTAAAPDYSVPFEFSGQLEMGDTVHTSVFPTADAPATADILDPNFPWENTMNDPGPAAGDSSRTTANPIVDDSRPCLTYATSSATNSTPSTDPTPPNNPYCSCTLLGTCSHCRLKQRVTRLEAESESLRATIEKARSVVGKHDGVLQDVHDSRRAPDSVMEELWRCQDELRKALSLCRE